MTSRIVKVEPFDLVVFGGTGDLAYRKLFPALFHRDGDEQFSERTRIIGVSRRQYSNDAFRATVKEALLKFAGADDASAPVVERFLNRIEYAAVDATGEGGWYALKNLLDKEDKVRAFYLATSPDLFGPIAKKLGANGLATPEARIIVEKPIGKDGASAAAINDELGTVFAEGNIFRIDHYLGKETVQNLMALRFANA
ncbi:MAG TPA: glucose-6-phosphate dehydrogenase, partial [Roseiarcus sp.]|nr:glucose-6-phosphate dehydrogenase [Roseiarcus sp.]